MFTRCQSLDGVSWHLIHRKEQWIIPQSGCNRCLTIRGADLAALLLEIACNELDREEGRPLCEMSCDDRRNACKVKMRQSDYPFNKYAPDLRREGRPPGSPNSLNFMQFLGNFGKTICWHHPWRVGALTSVKSLICH